LFAPEHLEKMMSSKALPLSRRVFVQGSIAVSTLSFAGPRSALSDTPNRGGHFKLGLKGGESTDTLDPALSLGGANSFALYAFGDRLIELGPNSELIPALAESWAVSDDATTWTFKIREGVRFHNGSTLTADDVVATLLRHSDEEAKSGALGVMRGIAAVERVENDVVITTTTPNADLPYLLNDYHLVIQPNGGLDAPAAGVGTGPYRLVSEEPGVRYAFEKFEDHWNANVGHYDTVELLIINDDTARVAALQSGQVHAIDRVPPRIAPRVDSVQGVSVDVVNGRGHYIFVMHTDTPPFDNNDLRLALKYAINREEMVSTILNGFGAIGNDIPINENYPLFDPSRLEQRPFSLDLAREHYDRSGHDGSPIVLHVSDAAFTGALDAAQLFQQSANAAGIPLQLQREPSDGYWSEVWNVKPFCASVLGRSADAGSDVVHRLLVYCRLE
jgi:peptide/nickel transport system substrate-binding protein